MQLSQRINELQIGQHFRWTFNCDSDTGPSDLVLLHDTPLGQDTSAYTVS